LFSSLPAVVFIVIIVSRSPDRFCLCFMLMTVMIMMACLSYFSSSSPVKETGSKENVSRKFVSVPNLIVKNQEI
jgi:hypothetical protein